MAQVLSDSIRVEFGYGSTPLTDLSTVTWTDVTSSVLLEQGLSFSRGRTGTDTSARPGTLSFTLDNSKQKGTEGRFTLGGTNQVTGLGLRIPVRVRARYPYISNLIANSSFETDTTGWFTFGSATPTLTSDATQYAAGARSMKVTWATSAAFAQGVFYSVPTVVGRTYTVSFLVKVPAGSPDVYATAYFLSSGSTITAKGAWTLAQTTFTATASSTWVGLGHATVATAGQSAYVDSVICEEGSTAHPALTRYDGTRGSETGLPPVVGYGTGTYGNTENNVGSGEPLDLYLGYIEALETDWEEGIRPIVRVSASDRLARLERRTLPSGLLLGEILSDNPGVVWPLDEAAGATAAGNRSEWSDSPNLTVVSSGSGGTLEFGVDSVGPGGAGSAAVLTPSGANFQYLSGSGLNGTSAFSGFASLAFGYTMDAFVYTTTSGAAKGIMAMYTPGTGSFASLELSSTNTVVARTEDAFAGISSTATSPSAISLDAWHHVAVTVAGASGTITQTLYVDGVSVASSTYSGTFAYWGGSIAVGAVPSTSGSAIGTPFNGRIALAGFTSGALSAARILQRSKGRTLFAGDTSGDRFNRICRAAGLAAADYSVVGTPRATMSAQEIDSTTNLFAAVSEVAEAEVGVVYAAASGDLVLATRAARTNVSSTFTLPASSINKGSSFNTDMTNIVNDVTVSRPSGITFRSVNTASVAAYDSLPTSSSIYVDTDLQVVSTAHWYSNVNATPRPRLTDVSIDVIAQAGPLQGLLPVILGMDVGTRFKITGLPSASSPATTLDLFLEGVSDRITSTTWTRTFVANPIYNAGAAMVLDSTEFGTLDGIAPLGI